MAIRIGITDGNREFFERFYTAFKEQYREEFEIYLFPDLEKALKAVELFRIRVILIEMPETGSLELPPGGLPPTAFYARLCDRKQTEKEWESRDDILSGPSLESIPYLCRFRSVEEWKDLIEKEVAALPGGESKVKIKCARGGGAPGTRKECRVVLFSSAAGGTGVSTAARGFTECCLRHGRHVLYLDLQTFPDRHGTPGDDLYTLEDILLSLRGRRYAPDAVLERALRTDESGSASLLPPANPAAIFDMTGEEIVTLIDLITELKRFSVIVLDMSFDSSERTVLPYCRADRAVLVTSGEHIANEKTERLLEALPALCMEEPLALYEKTCLLYDRFRKGRCEVMETELPYKLGGIMELPITDREDLVAEVSVAPAMERLYEALMQ